jgi:hypothetical protein
MKSIERHKLKENEFAHTVARTRDMVNERPREVATIAIAVTLVALIVGGFFAWKAWRDGKATTLLASALAVAEAQVVAPPPPAPGSAPPVQPPGTFRTDRERLEAALPLLQHAAAAATFKELSTDPNSTLPVDGILMQLGRAALVAGKTDEATRAFTRVVDEFPQSLYASEAKEKLAGLKKA